ncbi:type III secretion system domain-containing protein [Cupriavidus sp. AU9028]|uniref:type III secretion system domain-containing protein n=1 Tax=Cupriavidus sp. AU9028 TaxID=2871157 RepID=UPI001C9510CE|nr:type III secretion system domain-containing protein [Cupriavidus sp. AU9028]MBY4897872.1 type III secretion system subunit [Cupriavidus sp. AU9028]
MRDAPVSSEAVRPDSLAICPAVQRLHRLAWRPGETMHAAWWSYLGLDNWQDDYRRHAGCRRALDALIVQRRGYPDGPLPAVLTAQQRQMMALEPRLPSLLLALGAVAARLPDLLLLGEYRRPLAAELGGEGCEQLAALVGDGGRAQRLPAPSEVPGWLRSIGMRWLDETLRGSVVWSALAVCLPPPDAGPAASVWPLPDRPALPMLMRLDRLL